MRTIRRLAVVAASLVLGVVTLAEGAVAAGPGPVVLAQAITAGRLDPAVHSTLDRAGAVDALVTFQSPAAWDKVDPANLRDRTGGSDAPGSVTVAALDAADRALAAVGPGIETLRTYESFAVRLVRIRGAAALGRLLARPEVVRVRTDELRQRTLTQSLPLIKQPAAAAKGWTGSGTAVAVVDSGVDWTRDAFKPGTGGCTAVGTPAECRVTFARDFAPSDGVRDDTVLHGTNVAGIVLGVAPDTRILALDVFHGASSNDSWVLAAIDWTIANRATYKTRAINMSLGSGDHLGICDGLLPDFAAAFASARDAGIVPVVAAGNDAYVGGGYVDGVSAPACVSEALAVGAVYDGGPSPTDWGACVNPSAAADRILCWSQAGVALDLLAPGVTISAAGVTQGGTSQASPHVAGAVAALFDARPSASPGRVEAALEATGRSIADARNGRTYRRIDVTAAGAELLEGPSWSTPAAVGASKTRNESAGLARTLDGTTAILHAAGVADVVGGAPVADGGPFQGVSYLRSVGGAGWTTKRLNPTTKHGSRVAIAASGARVHVAWVQTTSVDSAADPGAASVLWVRSSADHGVTWGPAVRLSSTTGRVDYPTVAASGARVHVAWTDSGSGAVRVATSSNGGASFATPKVLGTADLVDPDGYGRYAWPVVVRTGSSVAVAWLASSASAARVRVRVSEDGGSSWTAVTSIATSGAYWVQAAATSGRIGVVWDAGTTIRYREWTGGAWAPSRTVAAFHPPGGWAPAVALQGTTRVGVAWTGCSDGACSRADLRWVESSTNGTSWSPPRLVVDPTSSGLRRAASLPSISWPSAGTRHVLFNGAGTSGGGATYRLYLATGTGSP